MLVSVAAKDKAGKQLSIEQLWVAGVANMPAGATHVCIDRLNRQAIPVLPGRRANSRRDAEPGRRVAKETLSSSKDSLARHA